MKSQLILAACLVLGMSSMPAGLCAMEASDTIALADASAPLSPGQMANLRGGFVDPNGFLVSFAVNVQTEVDGNVSFTRSFTIAPAANGQLQLANSNQSLTGNATILNNGAGIQVTGPGGTVTVLNQTAAGVPSSIVINTANNQNIKQTVDVGITLQNMQSILSKIGLVQQANALAAMMQNVARHPG